MQPKKLSILIILLTLSSLGAMAQNNFLPYSQFGLGEIDEGFGIVCVGVGSGHWP